MATVTVELESTGKLERPSWWTSLTTFRVAVGFLIAVGVSATLTDHFVEPDIFWHLRDAQYVVSHQHIVTQDLYSFTVSGAPWVSHEWLSELVYYGAYKVAGWQGVLGLYCGLMILLVLAGYWLALRAG